MKARGLVVIGSVLACLVGASALAQDKPATPWTSSAKMRAEGALRRQGKAVAYSNKPLRGDTHMKRMASVVVLTAVLGAVSALAADSPLGKWNTRGRQDR